MPRRTTIILDDDVYERLVMESIKRYGTARALSKVLNELVRDSLCVEDEFIQLVYSEKFTTTTQKEFERMRRSLSRELEDR